MRVLGLDLGARRIGLALSDPLGEFAFPEGTLERRSLSSDLLALCELVRERGVGRVVVGLPLHMSGRAGREAEAARRFASRLAEASGLPVDLLDERWTSVEAERALRETGGRGRRARGERGRVDAVAATLLLRTYLARRAPGRATRDAEP
jgi:putative Holliday junction resolvase